MLTRSRSRSLLVAVLVAVATAASGCSGGQDGLVLYNAQNSRLMTALTEAFTAESGIKVTIRKGGDSELSNQLVAEGAKSPADVFTTENSTAMAQVAKAGLFSALPASAVAGVPAQYVAGGRSWVGVAARATVLVYNPKLIAESALPKSMLDLEQPQWKGKFGYAPTGADFQAIASSVYALRGDAVGATFVQGLADNGSKYANNIAILKAVNSGEIPTGIIYHYYWFQDQADTGADSNVAQLHYFGDADPGAYLSVAGAGVLASSTKQAQAQQLVAFLAGEKGQRILAGTNDLQYAINSEVPSNPVLRPIGELGAPLVPLDALDGPKVLADFRKAGIL